MKLSLLAIIVFLLSPGHHRAGAAPSLPHSVCVLKNFLCEHKKTSLPGWLQLPRTRLNSPSRSLLPAASASPQACSLQLTIQTPSSL